MRKIGVEALKSTPRRSRKRRNTLLCIALISHYPRVVATRISVTLCSLIWQRSLFPVVVFYDFVVIIIRCNAWSPYIHFCMEVEENHPKIIGVVCGWHKVDNACHVKVPTVASSLHDSKVVMQFYRNRAVPSGVLRSKREIYNKTERLEASREKRKIVCIPTTKVKIFEWVSPFLV